MSFFESIKMDFTGICLALFILLLAWHKWSLGYWKRKGVPGPQPSLFFGNVQDFLIGKKTVGQIYRNIYNDLKAKGLPHGGAYFMGSPNYIPVDLKIVKSILQTNFQCFNSRGTYYDKEIDPLSANLFNLDGLDWKEMRSKMSPTFSSGKIKMMYPTILKFSLGLKRLLNESAMNNPVDIKDVINRFTIDVIGSTAFGLDIDSMKNPDNLFRKHSEKVFEPSLAMFLRYLPIMVLPRWALKKLKYCVLPEEVRDFFSSMVESTAEYREKNNIDIKDFMNLMLELKANGILTLNDIKPQSLILFLAGYETSSSTIQFASYELAVNQDVQEKARQEIDKVLRKYNNELTYEALLEMEYIERIVQETLRKHPPLQCLWRLCTKDCQIPDNKGIKINKGTFIMIPVLGIHYDREYYENPEKFDPDRFTEEEKRKRPSFSYLSFGEGPKMCIGVRFALIETKIGLVTLLKNFKITLNKKTISPIVYSTKSLLSNCLGGIWLDLERIY